MGRSQRMIQLLEDLLEYSKVARYDYKDESVNLGLMAEEQFNLQNAASEFNCTAPDITLNIPRVPLEITIRNLLSNAIKHHDKPRGNIIVSHHFTDDYNVITVQDDGPGIPVNMQHKVMEMFQTLKPRDDVEGSGMGLAMVKRIVRHYCGELEVKSDGKLGTCLLITSFCDVYFTYCRSPFSCISRAACIPATRSCSLAHPFQSVSQPATPVPLVSVNPPILASAR